MIFTKPSMRTRVSFETVRVRVWVLLMSARGQPMCLGFWQSCQTGSIRRLRNHSAWVQTTAG